MLEPGQSANVGFYLDQPFEQSRVILTVHVGTIRYAHFLPEITPRQIAAARRRLILPFLYDLGRASPAMLRWYLTRDLSARAAVKNALGLNQIAPSAAAPMTMDLFADAGSDNPSPGTQAQARISIVLPVFNAFELLTEALERVRHHTDLPWRLILIEDCSTDPRVRPFLREWAAARDETQSNRVTLLENQSNLGFIGSVNIGLALALGFGDHVVLLNSDALVPAAWASRLLRPILMHDNVATVTPMSNDAEICSVPMICQRTVLAAGLADRIDAVAQKFNPEANLAEVPTGVGFCMAINIAFLRQVGLLDTAFARGYGEEVDWCQRARAAGGRNLGLPGLFVEHRGGTSFGSAEKLKLVVANNAIVASR